MAMVVLTTIVTGQEVASTRITQSLAMMVLTVLQEMSVRVASATVHRTTVFVMTKTSVQMMCVQLGLAASIVTIPPHAMMDYTAPGRTHAVVAHAVSIQATHVLEEQSVITTATRQTITALIL